MAEITEFLKQITSGQDLTCRQAETLLDEVFGGEVPQVQLAAFLAAMRVKGETSQELAGLVTSMRKHAVKVTPETKDLIDIVGTGGARVKTFNVSTAASFVAAGAGAFVAKHGNRAITSKCGSADVLAALGVKIDAAPEVIAECIDKAHAGFMFAPMFHPAMKYVQPVRKLLGFRTVFNVLGPLTNPASAPCQVTGVPDEEFLPLIAETLKILGTKRAMIVHSDGLDEISISGPTKIMKLENGSITSIQIKPEEFGIPGAAIEQVAGGDAASNVKIVKDVITGAEKGPKRDIVLLNAAAGIIVAGLAEDFDTAIVKAQQSIDSGAALNCLEKMIEISNG